MYLLFGLRQNCDIVSITKLYLLELILKMEQKYIQGNYYILLASFYFVTNRLMDSFKTRSECHQSIRSDGLWCLFLIFASIFGAIKSFKLASLILLPVIFCWTLVFTFFNYSPRGAISLQDSAPTSQPRRKYLRASVCTWPFFALLS